MTLEQLLSHIHACDITHLNRTYVYITIHHQDDDDVTNTGWRLGRTFNQQSKKTRRDLRDFVTGAKA